MTMRSQCLSVLAIVAMCVAATGVFAETVGKSPARLATYESKTGDTYFALSVAPTKSLPVSGAHDVVVLIDTSATQSGAYRIQSHEVLAAMLSTLGENDRVQLVAVDTRPVPLTSGFVAPNSPEMKSAVAKLARRAPLGATDMSKALDYAATAFPAESKAARAAVYLGDGMNKASYLAGEKFAQAMDRLAEQQIAVSSCGIGVQRNVAMLAAIANQTGGNVTMANPAESKPQDAGAALAAVVQTPVAWPTDVKLPAQFVEVYPAKVPPLRADRDTILVGLAKPDGAADISIDAVSGGEKVTFQWSPMAEPSNEDFAFLPKLIDTVRPDRGATLPTVGSQGLREAARFVMTSAEELTELGHKALASGDVAGAGRAAKAALERDPANPKALALEKLAEKARTSDPRAVAAETVEPDLTLVRFPEDEASIERFDGGEGELLGKVEEYRSAQAGMIQTQIEEGLKEARQMLADGNSRGAVQELKKFQDNLERTPDLDAEIKADLLARVDSAIREAQRRVTIDEFRDAETQQKRAIALEQERVISEIANREEAITQLMARFTSLMEEGRYNDAERNVIPQVSQLSRDSTIASSAMWWADFARNINQMNDLVQMRNEMFNDSLYQVELSHVPFPDEPPIIYPSAEVWEDITIRRKKYSSVDLVEPGSAEENIMKEMEKETKVDVIETPFSDVIKDIAKNHEITIVLDPEGLDEAGVTPDQLVNLNLKGISLRSVLRILLGPLHLTYVVKDEVLQITSEEKASEQLVTKVYPVGDLVVPIMSGMGGMGMGGMGMGGMGMGGMGGGMGGMGGMGGGMGGMGGGGFGGMGGGGGGGFFDVEDDLKLDGRKADNAKKEAAPAAPQASRVRRPQAAKAVPAIKLDRQADESLDDAWDRYFAAQEVKIDKASDRSAAIKQTEAQVRQTVRNLMSEKDYAGAQALILAALRAGQSQPWMYEGLSLAMRATDTPKEEIERALMSGVDLSNDMESVMMIALYMSKAGLEESALNLYREIAQHQPTRPEPYVQGLACAKSLKDREGIMWACKGILSQAWERDHRYVWDDAIKQAKGLILDLKKDGQDELAAKFEAEANAAMTRDCIVVVSWTGDADLDLIVQEPSGTTCSLEAPRSTAGGVIVGDAFAQKDGASGQNQEVYVCPLAFSGEYRVLVKRIWGKVTAGKVTVDIYTHQGSEKGRHLREQLELGEKNAVFAFNLDDGRRKELLAEEQIANVARIQNAVGRQVLAQQLAQFDNSAAERAYAASLAAARGVDPRLLLAGLGGRGAVGFTIRPTILTEGLSDFTQAVISADRRYVRITPQPSITAIGQVTTFNVASGATNNVTNTVNGGGQNQGGGLGGIGGGGGLGGIGGIGGT